MPLVPKAKIFAARTREGMRVHAKTSALTVEAFHLRHRGRSKTAVVVVAASIHFRNITRLYPVVDGARPSRALARKKSPRKSYRKKQERSDLFLHRRRHAAGIGRFHRRRVYPFDDDDDDIDDNGLSFTRGRGDRGDDDGRIWWFRKRFETEIRTSSDDISRRGNNENGHGRIRSFFSVFSRYECNDDVTLSAIDFFPSACLRRRDDDPIEGCHYDGTFRTILV
jgi:hypothetical protein